eukprot:7926456-Alexandrium_andersonii.AAC.1
MRGGRAPSAHEAKDLEQARQHVGGLTTNALVQVSCAPEVSSGLGGIAVAVGVSLPLRGPDGLETIGRLPHAVASVCQRPSRVMLGDARDCKHFRTILPQALAGTPTDTHTHTTHTRLRP